MNPIIIKLRPYEMIKSIADGNATDEEPIPYMAIAPDEGWNLLVEGNSEASGDYIIEEKDVEDRNGEAVYRRLVFLKNQNFVQTEARMVLRKDRASGGNHKKSSKKRSISKSKPKKNRMNDINNDGEFSPIDEFEFDYSYLDYHHRCFLSALTLSPSILKRATDQSADSKSPNILIIGFAGGAVSMTAQKHTAHHRN